MELEIVDGEVWRIVRGKKAGVKPARPERREFWSRDPEFVRVLLQSVVKEEAQRQGRVSGTNAAESDLGEPPPDLRDVARTPAKSRAGKVAGDGGRQAAGIPRRPELPGWPRGLHEDWAAAYVGLSTSSFRTVARDEGISAVWLTARRKVYLREDLDAWLDRKAGRTNDKPLTGWEYLDCPGEAAATVHVTGRSRAAFGRSRG